MAKSKGQKGGGWTASQVVAHNLTLARELRGLTQAEIATRLSGFTGSPWSATTVAQAEGSVSGNRIRQFTANELAALARTFDLPLVWFFLPPEDRAGKFRTADYPKGWPWEYLCLLVWGHLGNFPVFAEHAAPWAHASTVLVPAEDLLDPQPDDGLLARLERDRERLTPDVLLAVGLNGLVRRRIRGSHITRNRKEKPADTLRALANLIEAFENYPPGAFLDDETLRRVLGVRLPPTDDDS